MMDLDSYKISIFNDDRLYKELKNENLIQSNSAGYPTITAEVMAIINKNYSQTLDIAKKNIEEAFNNGIKDAEEQEVSTSEREFIDPITGKKETRIGKLAYHGPNTYIAQHPMIKKAIGAIKNQKYDIFTLGPKMILKMFDAMEGGSNILKGIHKDINEIKKAFKSSDKIEIEKIKEDVEIIKKQTNDEVEPAELLISKLNLVKDSYLTLISSINIISNENNPSKGKYIATLEKNKLLINQVLINGFNGIIVARRAINGIKKDFPDIEKVYSKELNNLSLMYESYDKKSIIDSFNALNTIRNIGIDNNNFMLLIDLLDKLGKSNINNEVLKSLSIISDWTNLDHEIDGIVINYNFSIEQLELLEKYKAIKKGIENNSDILKNIYLEWENKDGVRKSCKLMLGQSSYVIKDIKNTDKLKEGTRVVLLTPKVPKEGEKLVLTFDTKENYIIDNIITVKYFDSSENKSENDKPKNTIDDLAQSQEKYNAAILRLVDKKSNFKNWKEIHNKLKDSYEKRKIKVYDIIAKLGNKGDIAKKDTLAYKAATGQLTDISWIENSYGVNRILNLLNIKENYYKFMINQILKEQMEFSFKHEDLNFFNNGKEIIDNLSDLIVKLLPEDIKDYTVPYEKWLENYKKYNEELKKLLTFAKEKIKVIPKENIKKDSNYNEDFYEIIINESGDIFENLEACRWFYNDFVKVIKPKNETLKIVIKNKNLSQWILEKRGK